MASMGRSDSAPALMSAGSALMTHVPKRVTQHGIFMPGFEVPPTQLKPGQASLQRQLYMQEARDHEETYLEKDLPKGSVYQRTIESKTQPSDYFYPQKPIKQTQPPPGEGHHATGHWKSTYRSTVNDAARFDTVLYRQNGPSYQIANPPTCVSSGDLASSYHEFHGKYGENPRHKLPVEADRLPTLKGALTVGTTKGTAHIPGYQGFLATNTANKRVAEIAHGGTMRSTDKTNLTHVFHTNMIGYAGHKPDNARNDRGGVSTNTITTQGRDFQHPPMSSYY